MKKPLSEFSEIFISIIKDFESNVLIWKAAQGDTDKELTVYINELLIRQYAKATIDGNKPLAILIKHWLSQRFEYSYFKGRNTVIYNIERYKEGLLYIPCPQLIEYVNNMFGAKINRFEYPVMPENITEDEGNSFGKFASLHI